MPLVLCSSLPYLLSRMRQAIAQRGTRNEAPWISMGLCCYDNPHGVDRNNLHGGCLGRPNSMGAAWLMSVEGFGADVLSQVLPDASEVQECGWGIFSLVVPRSISPQEYTCEVYSQSAMLKMSSPPQPTCCFGSAFGMQNPHGNPGSGNPRTPPLLAPPGGPSRPRIMPFGRDLSVPLFPKWGPSGVCSHFDCSPFWRP